MADRPKRTNPFYVLLVLAGIAFAVTACSYFVLMLNQLEHGRRGTRGGLLAFMDTNGIFVMTLEIAVLAVSTVAAIGTDRFWNPEEKEGKSP